MAYIDPITGAYVADSLDALPPGYNQPKAGNEANVAKMRAQLNNSWDNNEPLPNLERPATDPFSLVKKAYEHMPGAGVAQGVIPAILGMPQFLASLGYGLGNQVVNPETANFNKDTTKAMQALQYTPPTQAGRDISDFIGKVGEATGPLPELWNTRMRFTPDELRVLGKTATEDVRNFGSDYANAKAGVQREYPTAGSRAAQFTDVAGDWIRPMAEKAYDMYMNPRDTESFSINPVSNLSGLVPSSGPMYAVKPKGGNWPTNLGSTLPLAEQGDMGKHLSSVQISDPIKAFENQIEKHYTDSMQSYRFEKTWQEFLKQYAQAKTPGVGYEITPEIQKEAADAFAKEFNDKLEENGGKPLASVSELEKIAPTYNAWVMGPYQKYMVNQMATGLSSDPVLQAFNESNLSLEDYERLTGTHKSLRENDERWAKAQREDYLNSLTNYGSTPPPNESIGKQTATTPVGIAVENAMDASLLPSGTYRYGSESGYPQASKLPKNSVVNDLLLSDMSEASALPNIQQQVLRDLVSGNIDVNKISNLTPGVVARQLIKDEMEKQKALQSNKDAAKSYLIARNKELPVDIKYPDGSQMVVFTKADYDKDPIMLTRDLSQITKDLHQCIGAGCHNTDEYQRHGPVLEPHTGKPPKGSKGTFNHPSYFEGLQNGTREIASLKNPEGISEFTANVMVRGNDFLGTPTTHKGFVRNWIENELISGREDRENWQPILDELDRNGNTYLHSVLESTPKLKDDFYKHFLPKPEKYITEMKGYDNGEIKSEYIPYIKEWLNKESPNLSRVTMDRLEGEIFDLNDAHSANNILERKHQKWSSIAIENLLMDARDNNLLPRFFDDKDFETLAQQKGIDLTEDPIHSDKPSDVAQWAYENVSDEIRRTFEDNYVRDAFNGDDDNARDAILTEVEDRPYAYGMTNYSPMVRNQVIRRLHQEGLHNPNTPTHQLGQIANEIRNFEAEPNNYARPTPMQADVLRANIDDLLDGQNIDVNNMVEPFATDMRILRGSQRQEARLPLGLQREIVGWLLDQDNNTTNIRRAIDQLQRQGAVGMDMTNEQAENILNMLISWTERYPLDER